MMMVIQCNLNGFRPRTDLMLLNKYIWIVANKVFDDWCWQIKVEIADAWPFTLYYCTYVRVGHRYKVPNILQIYCNCWPVADQSNKHDLYSKFMTTFTKCIKSTTHFGHCPACSREQPPSSSSPHMQSKSSIHYFGEAYISCNHFKNH